MRDMNKARNTLLRSNTSNRFRALDVDCVEVEVPEECEVRR